MVKELRGFTRQARFFLLHSALMVAGGLILLGMTSEAHSMYSAGQEGYDAASLGIRIYGYLRQAILLAVAVIVPGFCASAISSEKDRGTFDLLICAAVDPLQVIRGKFLAAMLVVAVMTTSVIPLLALTFFFGGVSALHVAGFTFTLAVFAALMASAVIYVSSIIENSTWATLASYTVAFFIGLCFIGFLSFVGGSTEVAALYGIPPQPGRDEGGFVGRLMLAWLLPIGVCAWLTAFCFTAAAAVLDRLPAYRLEQTHRAFRWVRETGLALLAALWIVSFLFVCLRV
jgi:ABC-type transport system involved in multi-copper enzyme maturation permease subunit